MKDAGRSDPVNRRQLLQLAGSLGVAVTVGACASRTAVGAPAPSPSSASPPADGEVPPRPVDAPSATDTPVQASSPTTPTPAGTSAIVLCRSAWGAQPARPGGRPHTITRMTLHHSAVVLGDNRNAPARLRQHQRYHQGDRGWIDIAYHAAVDRNGNIYQLRTPELAGDTATDYDTAGHFLVLCEGDFDQEAVSEAQLDSAAMAFAWATQQFHVTGETLTGHRDHAATTCPGANLYAHVSSGDIQRRMDGLLAAGPVNLREVCGPEAATKVAEIEAGS